VSNREVRREWKRNTNLVLRGVAREGVEESLLLLRRDFALNFCEERLPDEDLEGFGEATGVPVLLRLRELRPDDVEEEEEEEEDEVEELEDAFRYVRSTHTKKAKKDAYEAKV
jgi:hypothetical protein